MILSVGLLIEPVWNRNTSLAVGEVEHTLPFNRTSMESKTVIGVIPTREHDHFLIEPVWNRNLSRFCQPGSERLSFNRNQYGIETNLLTYRAETWQ